jgi:hypothetical protein
MIRYLQYNIFTSSSAIGCYFYCSLYLSEGCNTEHNMVYSYMRTGCE